MWESSSGYSGKKHVVTTVMRKHDSGKISTHCLCENPEHLVMLGVPPPPPAGPIAKHIPCSHALFFPLPKTQCRETTNCLGTRSKRMRLSSWSSSSITAASGYICSMSKWNWTPAGGSRRKFLLSWRQGEHQGEENKQRFTRGVAATRLWLLTADRASICCWMVSSSL